METPSFIHKKEEYLERVAKDNTDIRLLARHDSLEVMKQKIAAGSSFYLDSSKDWKGFEFIYIVKGEMAYTDSEPPVCLEAGDYIARQDVPEESWFETESDVVVLYVSSQPAFYLLRDEIEDYLHLAKEIESKEHMDDHSKRLVRMSTAIGKKLGLETEKLADLRYASFFHDIGKAKVPDRILEKDGDLNDEEWEIMEKHTVWGREMLEASEQLSRAGKIVEQTHERVDGKGYPRGLTGEELTLEAKIVSVVDAWDAMRNDRPYRDALSREEAIEELEKNKGSQFDPRVVDTFLAIIREREEELEGEATVERGKYNPKSTRSLESERLFRFSREIRSSESVEEIMSLTLEAATESSPFQRALISIFDGPVDPTDPEPVYVEFCDHYGLSSAQEESFEGDDLVGTPVNVEKFDPRYRLGGGYYVPHEVREEEFDVDKEITSELREEDTLNWHPDDSIYVPLYRGDKIIGQISLDDPEHGLVPDPEDIRIIESFASVASLALESSSPRKEDPNKE